MLEDIQSTPLTNLSMHSVMCVYIILKSCEKASTN
ncbi:hypothetical protein PPL_00767 [Heterostelium album PN500]|uniref:Uncharacterized protein n=1 Tax=Heterostelium pallidum (strain ATCC 26659 / Pp 5 / PN500) TaxID=670386 RepID=D3AXD6_HETP5|nr:hypothetical protein PPL_00767 [Heterostelium album PN500]EFA86205.1 hypothetical protein PPL_00767 [Heterostelium album PN500]|eukprot:XP_020438310.1 hypothetical protein PPL_00767 [Heterostelium album PN500]